jgi:acetyl-CoA carboxylase biotin carboxyl carrier protein
MRRLDLNLVRHALDAARQHGFAEVELDSGEDHFHAKLEPIKVAAPIQTSSVEDAALATTSVVVKSPAVGYFREGNIPLVAGLELEKGDLVGMIVALGISNDVESEWAGTVAEVFVKTDQAVEYGQPILRIEQ